MYYLGVIFYIILALTTLIFLCSFSRPIKFYVKLVSYYVAIFTVTAASIPFSLRRIGDPQNLLYASWCVHHIVSPIFGLKWEVKNKEILNSKEPCVFVCNHQSALDISGMMYIWPLFHPCVPVLKKELLFSGPFGIFCWLAGCIFLDRFNSKKARDTLNVKIKEMKQKKIKLWIFPEGTRNDSGTLLPFKKGAFHIAIHNKIPVVPIVFSEYENFYSISQKIFHRGTITVTVLPAVRTDDKTDVPALTTEVRNLMTECLRTITPSLDRPNGFHRS